MGTSEFIVSGIREHVSYLADARVAAIHPGALMSLAPPLPSRRPYTLITTSQLPPPKKRHQDLIRACGQLKREGMDFSLRIVGTGDQEQTLRALLAVEPSVLDEWRRAVQAHARATFSQEAQFEKFAAFLESCRPT